MDFGDTLDSLASFGNSIGGTVTSVYKALNVPQLPVAKSTLPQGAAVVSSTAPGSVNVTTILLLVAAGFAVALGIRAFGKK